MADADILKITQRGKHMHRNQARRLLLSAPHSDAPSKLDPTKTQSEVLEELKQAVDFRGNTKLSDREEREVKDVVGVVDTPDDPTERPVTGHVPPEYK